MPAAISIENLGKRYLVDHDARRGYRTLRESLVDLASAPLRSLRGQRSASREEFWALKDVSFEVQPGEVVGIIGRNGAGKSTLLKILSQISKPTKGRVRLNGRVGSLLEVGTGFHPELTGRENIYLNGSILGMTRREIDHKFDAIVDFAEIEKFLDTPVKRYSSGMYVRLAFAVAAYLQPEILIIDEVLAVGDAAFQRKCLGRIGAVAKSGRTVLFVSHNISSLQQLCNTAAYLVDGQLVSTGDCAKVFPEYLKSLSHASSSSYSSPAESKSDAEVFLEEAALLDGNGQPSGMVRFGEPFHIRQRWRHQREIPGLSYSLRLYNSHDILIFAANTINSELPIEANGIHSTLCTISPNLLTPGNYRIALGAWVRPFGALADIPDCLTLIVDSMPFRSSFRFNAAGNPVIAAPAHWDSIE